MLMTMLTLRLCVMSTESGLERGAAGMQGTSQKLPSRAPTQGEERVQGEVKHHL